MAGERIKKSGSKLAGTAVTVFGWKYISGMFGYLKQIFTMIVTGPHKGIDQSFEEAVEQYQLTAVDLKKKMDSFLKQSIVLACVALLFFCFAIFRLYAGFFMQGSILLAITFLLLANAFRSHFWYFQIKQRKLGCTFSEWLLVSINRNKLK